MIYIENCKTANLSKFLMFWEKLQKTSVDYSMCKQCCAFVKGYNSKAFLDSKNKLLVPTHTMDFSCLSWQLNIVPKRVLIFYFVASRFIISCLHCWLFRVLIFGYFVSSLLIMLCPNLLFCVWRKNTQLSS